MALTIDPSALQIAATHNLVNGDSAHLACKVKSTNNDHHRLKLVYDFVDAARRHRNHPNGNFSAQAGPSKEDKLVTQFLEAGAYDTDAAAHFKGNPPQGLNRSNCL